MTALGYKRTICDVREMSALLPKADIRRRKRQVRQGPKSGLLVYSITSLARTNKLYGIVRPSALAVLRLTIISNLVARSMGRSPGFARFIILSTNVAACRNMSGQSVAEPLAPPPAARSGPPHEGRRCFKASAATAEVLEISIASSMTTSAPIRRVDIAAKAASKSAGERASNW